MTNTNANLDAAVRYAELGYPVFPCAPNAKRPLTANGLLDATLDPGRIEAYWADTPAANVAIRTDGLLVVDVDGSANPWLSGEPEKLLDLAAATMALTPRGGKHYVFRQPDGAGLRNTAGKLAANVDTRADGGYILVAPSQVGGAAYRWVDGSGLDSPRERLPEPPAWLLEALRAAAIPKREPGPREPLVAIDATKPGDDFCQRATWGEILEPHGWTYESTAADGAERWTRPGKDDGVSATAGHCKSDAGRDLFYVFTPNAPPLEAGQTYSKFAAYATLEHGGDYGAAATALAGKGYGQRVIVDLEDGEPSEAPQGPGKFPAHLLRVPGFIDSVMDWNLSGARKPQPILALAGALCLLSVLTGRKISDPFGTRTNLYCLAVGESGSGKERSRTVAKDVLYNSGLGRRCKEGIASHTGIINAVDQTPEIIYLVDEIGELLRTLTAPSAPAHLKSIIRVLMTLFTSSSGVFIGDTFADVKNDKAIINPHVVLYGATVPKSLYEGFTSESVSNGFLSRMLVFETDERPKARPNVRTLVVPQAIIDVAQFWGRFEPEGFGNLSDKMALCPLIVPYTTEAEEIMARLEDLAYEEQNKGKTAGAPLWSRTTEKAHKLALLYACSENHVQPMVGRTAAQWGAELSEYLTRKMIVIAHEWIAENPFHAKRKRVLRAIRAAMGGLTQSQLCRATRHLTNRERTEITESLLAAGDVRIETIETAGRPRTFYRAA